jgi:uncharacterized protein (TIGR03435 family)
MLRRWRSVPAVGILAAGWVVPLALCVAAQPPGTSGHAARSEPAVPAKLPEWDVVSVKRAEPGKCPGPEGSGLMLPKDGVHIFCLSPQLVIELAYGITEPSRILGVPEWAKSGGWNIDAKVAGEDVAALGKLSRDDRSRMLQALLVDRFHLKAHIEKREMPVYDLVVAKGGPKLKEATAEEASQAMLLGAVPGKIKCVSMPLSTLPPYLNRELGRPMVDKTGLTGKYDFTLEFVPAAKAGSDETGGPSVFTAVEEQLGLKLEPAKEPMDVLVIDSIEQPAAN